MSAGTSEVMPVRSQDHNRGSVIGRSAFRQRLVDAESGIRLLFRADGTLFFHSFVCCAVVSAGMVLGLSLLEWALLFVCFSMVVFAELIRVIAERVANIAGPSQGAQMSHQDFKDGHQATSRPSSSGEEIIRLATTGTVLTSLCSVVIIGLLLGNKLSTLFQSVG